MKKFIERIKPDFTTLVFKGFRLRGIELTGIFEIHTLNDEVVENDGQRISLNNQGILILRAPSASEIRTSILYGYFVDNLSSPQAFKWRLNLFDNLSAKDKNTLGARLRKESEKHRSGLEKKGLADDIYNSLGKILQQAFSEVLYQSRTSEIHSEAELKYLLHNTLKVLLERNSIEGVIVLVEYKIRQGNDTEAWFSQENFEKKSKYFDAGFELTRHKNFVKVKLKKSEVITAENKKIFNAQKDRTFKVDLILLNSNTGEVCYLIELKYGTKISVDQLESDVVKFMIYNSIENKNAIGLTAGYNSNSKEFLIKSNNELFADELTSNLNGNRPKESLLFTRTKVNIDDKIFSEEIIKMAKDTLFDETAYGSYANLVESSWQAEFNYRLRKYLPQNFKIFNEYLISGDNGRIDLAILNENYSPKYFIEFKHHGEAIPLDLKNKIFLEKNKIFFFIEQMKSNLKKYDGNNFRQINTQSVPIDNDGNSIYSSSFVEKIIEIYVQYFRMINLIKKFPHAKGFMFFNDWGKERGEYDLKYLGITRDEFNQCYHIRESIIEKLLDVDLNKDKVIFKYFNLLT